MDQSDLIKFVLQLLDRLAVKHMVVGSIASAAWGEPRFTHDIDIVIDPTSEQLDELCQMFPAEEFYVSVEAARQALQARGQFNVIHPDSGMKIDFMIPPTSSWGEEQMRRREIRKILPDVLGATARPEDIIISKMLYYNEGGSEKHLRDITGMLKVSGDEIDREYIEKWARELNVLQVWEAILKRIN